MIRVFDGSVTQLIQSLSGKPLKVQVLGSSIGPSLTAIEYPETVERVVSMSVDEKVVAFGRSL